MLKEKARAVALGVLGLDLVTVTIAFFASYWLRSSLLPELGLVTGGLFPRDVYLPLLPLALISFGVFLVGSGRYRSHRRVPILREAKGLLKSTVASAAFLISLIYLLRLDAVLLDDEQISRSWIILFSSLAGILLLLERAVLRLVARVARRRGYNYRTILIVGTNSKARQIAQVFKQHDYWGYRVLGFVAVDSSTIDEGNLPYPIAGSLEELPQIVQRNVVDEVIFSIRRDQFEEIDRFVVDLEARGICIRFVLNLFPETRARIEVGDLDGIPMLTFATTSHSQLQMALKRSLDVSISATLLVVCLPLFVAISVLIKLRSPGPIFFRQTRIGLHGRRFDLIKFRTMVPDAEERKGAIAHLNEMDGPVFKMKNDPRVTPFGRALRRLSLDELPQFWNVLRGEMSLVGPRPPTPDEITQYERWQTRRLSMRPGLTCLWQVSGRNQIDFERWMKLDLEYIDSWSQLLDLKILLRTIPAVLHGRGAS